MAPLRIAMICDMVPGQAGGSYISTVRFAERLRARGHHVIIVAARDSRKPPVSEYRGIPIYQYRSFPIPGSHRYYFQSLPLPGQLKKLFVEQRVQIVHIMFPSPSCFVAKRLARRLSLPLVAHIHTQPENISIFLPRLLRGPWLDRLVLRYLAWFVRGADRIICPSELGRRTYQDFDPSLPITVLSNGIDLAAFGSAEAEPEKEAVAPPQLLFVGRLTKDKDPKTLVRALPDILQSMPSIQLRMVGTGPLQSELVRVARELGVSGHITFLGKISDAELLAEYRACTLFVLPSRVELEGMVALEAMACGAPLLIADSPTSATPQFVRENGLLFPAGDAHALAAQALRILGDDHLRAQMSQASRADVKAYDIQKSVSTLEELYHSLV